MSRVAWLALLAVCASCKSTPAPTIITSTTVPKRSMPVVADAPGLDEWEDEEVGGVGAIELRASEIDPGRLSLASVVVRARQLGDVAEVQVEHRFHSDAEVPLEGTFRFPLPDGAIVTGLAMNVGGKMVEGELVDNAKARKIYQEIVDQMQDPVLMEWEHGSTFKMRVFPIDPHADKIVTLRYLAPLKSHKGAPRFVQGTRAAAGGTTIPSLRIEWNGTTTFDEQNVARGRVIELPALAPAGALSEARADGTYEVVRVRPDWASVPASKRPTPHRWMIVVDTSRSALEERKLALEGLRAVLHGLPASDEISVATSDLETSAWSRSWQRNTPAMRDEAVRFVDALPIDGATDLGRMLTTVGAAVKGEAPTGVVYIGDCEPSWGELDGGRLEAQAKALAAPLYPLLIGDATDGELARRLASATGGRAMRVQRSRDLSRFVRVLVERKKSLQHLAIDPIDGASILTDGATTLDEGETLLAFVRASAGAPTAKVLTLRADADGTPVTTVVSLSAEPTAMVARRYGAALVRSLERAGRPKEEIVAASIEHTVMSKHTSFLVLDSEEAYERYQIERRAKVANAVAQNEAPNGEVPVDAASISAERIQPGDPEIEIVAPRDALRVLVILPNGEVKRAEWDDEARRGRGAWMVRFLVDRDVPEGIYEARVLIELADGHTETRTVKYTVDTTAPQLDVRMTPRRDGRVSIEVTQRGARAEIDARRVEALTPDGQVIVLPAIRWGVFRGTWKPSRPAHGETVRFVGVDEALNHTTLDVVLK